MKVVESIAEMRAEVAGARGRGERIGLVPTMGALHEGHLSLIRAARAECGYVVVSLFVNPAQFGPNEDLARYPRAWEADLAACGREKVDAIFAPTREAIYPAGYRTYVEVHELQNVLCGASRPIHFRGVATVVLKLFNIVQPGVAYFGEKDAQQARIIRQMVDDLNVPVEIRTLPIVREADGLALSSRNRYLDPEQRQNATGLNQALREIEAAIRAGERDAVALQARLEVRLRRIPGAEVDYAKIVGHADLLPQATLRGKVLVAVAVKFGGTRLIDNVQVEVE